MSSSATHEFHGCKTENAITSHPEAPSPSSPILKTNIVTHHGWKSIPKQAREKLLLYHSAPAAEKRGWVESVWRKMLSPHRRRRTVRNGMRSGGRKELKPPFGLIYPPLSVFSRLFKTFHCYGDRQSNVRTRLLTVHEACFQHGNKARTLLTLGTETPYVKCSTVPM